MRRPQRRRPSAAALSFFLRVGKEHFMNKNQTAEENSGEASDLLTREGKRAKTIVHTSIIGIIANLFLVAFKAVIGMSVHSIAILLDAVNNLSDAASSVITIAGTALAGKRPDKKHPLGYGRVEYLTAMIIAVIVLYAGITSLIESVKKIIHPTVPEYTMVALVIVAAAVIVKILLGLYVRSTGEKTDSQSLKASGSDALFDAILSAATLAAAIIYMLTGLSLEAWLGLIIAAIIIKSGIDMLRETLSKILGERPDSALAINIKKSISELDGVGGAYDLVLHNYGPDMQIASVHIEVADDRTASEIDALTRQITQMVYEKYHVIMESVGIYSVNSPDQEIGQIRDNIQKILMTHPEVIGMHGFFLDQEEMTISMDVVLSFSVSDRMAFAGQLKEELHKEYPKYQIWMNIDTDLSD